MQVCLQAAQTPDLWLTQKAEPTTAAPGAPIRYTLTFTNEGNLPATGIVLTDVIPSGVLYTAYASSGVLVTATGSVPYVWQVSNLAVGQHARIRVTGQITPSFGTGVLTNTAVIHTVLPESRDDNNQATAVTLVRDPIDLQVSKTASADIVLASSPLTYTVWVSNAGPGVAHEVLVTDDLPAGVVLLQTPPGCSQNNDTLLCSTAVLSASHILSYTYGVWVTGLSTGTLTNTVQVTAVESELAPINNSATTTTFANTPLLDQAYPGTYPLQSHPGYTGAKEVNTLGYTFNNQAQDALYDISLTVPHTSTNLLLALEASGLSDLSEESWGIDNVKVCLGQPLTYIPFLQRP